MLIIELGVDKDAQRSSDNCHNDIAVQHFVRLFMTGGSWSMSEVRLYNTLPRIMTGTRLLAELNKGIYSTSINCKLN